MFDIFELPKTWIKDAGNTTPLKDADIYSQLETAGDNNQLLVTFKEHRKIGKSTALIKYAKDNGYAVLVGSNLLEKEYKKAFDYDHIMTINRRGCGFDGYSNGFVVDEGCSRKKIRQLVDSGLFIVTGFMRDGSDF